MAGLVEVFLGVKVERKSLKDIARPLIATDPAARLPAVTRRRSSHSAKDMIMQKDSRRPVVVAVGGSGSGRAAIQLAATEAGYRQAPLIAVTAYQSASQFGASAARPVATMRTPDDERLTAEAILGDEVVGALGDEAEQAELRTVAGLPGRKLVETARAADAQLIVLASGLSTSVLAGAVSQYVLRNAPCPVLIVPDRLKP